MLFEIKDLYKCFGEKQVLQGIGFKAESGRAVGLLGRNGAGKTTTIRITMGVFPQNSGQVLLDGKPIRRDKVNIGYLPEEHGLYPKQKVAGQMVYFARLRGMEHVKAKASVAYWLERLGMQEYTNRRLETLSKGNQQKIQLATALVANPDFVILDEPFSGLDPVNASILKDIVKELIHQGKIVLFSSHQMSYVEEFCDDIAILHQGHIVLSGAIGQIKRSYDRSRLVIKSTRQAEIAQYSESALGALVESVAQKQDGLVVKLRGEEKKMEYMAAITQRGVDLDAISVFEPSLNDIFVEYTGDQEGGKAS